MLLAAAFLAGTGPAASGAVSAADPFGQLDRLIAEPGRLTVRGWAIDPDTTGPVIVQMYVDSRENTMAWANQPRPDVEAAYPGTGPDHGFTMSLDVSPGAHRVCVFAINTGPGNHTTLGCRSVTVPDTSPFGNFERVSVEAGRLTVRGWAIDPDTTGPVIVQMYVDSRENTMAWANQPRPDVEAAYPSAGPDHGFTMSLDVSPGAHRVCVFAINTGPGNHTTLGCRWVAGPPFFVYGSLRHGQSGYYLISGRTTSEVDSRMPGLDMYRLSGSSFPYAVPNVANTAGIVGEVMRISPDQYSYVVSRLDRYERYDPSQPPTNQTYVRELRPTQDGLPSWVYVAGTRQADYLRSAGILITSGDFLRW